MLENLLSLTGWGLKTTCSRESSRELELAHQGPPLGHKAPQGSRAHATSLVHLLSASRLTPDRASLSEKEEDMVSGVNTRS